MDYNYFNPNDLGCFSFNIYDEERRRLEEKIYKQNRFKDLGGRDGINQKKQKAIVMLNDLIRQHSSGMSNIYYEPSPSQASFDFKKYLDRKYQIIKLEEELKELISFDDYDLEKEDKKNNNDWKSLY